MYSIMILLSLVLGMGFAAFRCYRKKVPGRFILYLVMLVVVMVLYCALMVTIVLSRGKGIGLNASGGAMGLILGVFIMALITPAYKKIYADSLTMVLPLMYGLGKIGCSSSGCCAGLPYHGIFKVIGKEGTEVFPIQALEAIVFLALFLLTVIIDIMGKYDFRVMAIVYALTKIALDFLRDTHVDRIITLNQIMCIGIVIAFLIGYGFFWRKAEGGRKESRTSIG